MKKNCTDVDDNTNNRQVQLLMSSITHHTITPYAKSSLQFHSLLSSVLEGMSDQLHDPTVLHPAILGKARSRTHLAQPPNLPPSQSTCHYPWAFFMEWKITFMIPLYDTRQNQKSNFSVWHSERQHDGIPPISLRCSGNETKKRPNS